MTAWKDHERRTARALGGERSGPLGKHSSDAVGTDYALECKRTTRYSLRRAWVEQARRQGRDEGKPWLLVIAEHGDRAPIAVVDFKWFAETMAELHDLRTRDYVCDDCQTVSTNWERAEEAA